MANWSNPLLTSTYTNFLTEVKDRDTDVALQFNNAGTLGTGASNIPTNAVGWDASASRWKKYNGTSWAELADPYNLTSVGVTSATVPANGIYLPATNTVGISTGGTGKVYVTSGGNVGIGTANPNSPLDVLGSNRSIQFGSTTRKLYAWSDSAGVSLFNGDSQTGDGIYIDEVNHRVHLYTGSTSRLLVTSTGDVNIKGAGTAGVSQAVSFSGSAPVNSLVVSSGGNVGIGENLPSYQLHTSESVRGNIAIQGKYNGGTDCAHLRFLNINGQVAGVVAETDAATNPTTKLLFQATNSGTLATRMTLTPTGLGIGTTSPGSLLELSGSGSASELRLRSTDTTNAIIRSYVNSLEAGKIGFTSGRELFIETAGTERARIDSSGRLLVGTSTSRQVNASIAALQLQIEGTTYNSSSMSLVTNQNVADGSYLVLGKSRGTSLNSSTIVNSGDSLGAFWFCGADGTDLKRSAVIEAFVDGTPGANDMPGRLVFSTTADGASSPTARATINNLGYLTGTVNGLSSGIYPAQQYYRLNADYTGSNVNTAQSLFGVGVTLIGSTQYEFECLMILQAATITTATTVSFDFGGTATINNIAFMGTGPGITGKPAFGGYDGTPTSFYYTSATGGDITATNAAGVSAVIDLVYLIKGTVSINAGGTFIPRYKFSSAPGNAWVTARGSYFSIWPLGASGSNISIGSWA